MPDGFLKLFIVLISVNKTGMVSQTSESCQDKSELCHYFLGFWTESVSVQSFNHTS